MVMHKRTRQSDGAGVPQPFDLQPWTLTDASTVLELRRAVWGADHHHATIDFLRWMYAATPPGEACGVVLRKGAQVIGFAGLCRKRLLLDGQVVRLAHGLDYMIHPGLNGLVTGHAAVTVAQHWRELTRQKGFAIGLVFPNKHSMPVLTSEFVGMKRAFDPVLMLRPLAGAGGPSATADVPAWMARPALWLGARLANATAALRAGPGGPELQPADRFGPEYDLLWDAVAPAIRLGVVRDAAYLNWRYVDHPAYRYDRLELRRDGKLHGLIVGRQRVVHGIAATLVVDLLALGDKVGLELVQGLVRHAQQGGQSMVAALTIPGSQLHRALARCGFLSVPTRLDPKPFHAVAMVGGDEIPLAWDPLSWYFTWGDVDVV